MACRKDMWVTEGVRKGRLRMSKFSSRGGEELTMFHWCANIHKTPVSTDPQRK